MEDRAAVAVAWASLLLWWLCVPAYDYLLYSYNIPELVKGTVEVSPYEIQQVALKNKPEQVRFK